MATNRTALLLPLLLACMFAATSGESSKPLKLCRNTSQPEMAYTFALDGLFVSGSRTFEDETMVLRNYQVFTSDLREDGEP